MPGPRLLQPGDPAPAITLAAINRDGDVALSDYRGRAAVLLGLFRGLHCPFCRRQIVQLAKAQPQLAELGVETVAVMNTTPDRAKVYFAYRPTPVVLLADPGAVSHRAFGVPAIEFSESGAGQWPIGVRFDTFATARINPTGELPQPASPFEANTALNTLDGFTLTPDDEQIVATHGSQLAGHFLIDRAGVIRWTHMEALHGPTALGVFPTPNDLVAAAHSLGTDRA